MNQLVINAKVHFQKGRRARKEMRPGENLQTAMLPAAPLRLPRITKMMALAIRFDQLVQTGAVRHYAELARLGQVQPHPHHPGHRPAPVGARYSGGCAVSASGAGRKGPDFGARPPPDRGHGRLEPAAADVAASRRS